MTDTHVLAAATGVAVPLGAGDAVRIINTHGTQTVDAWALSAQDPTEHLSMEQTRRMLYNLYPRLGDELFSNRRTPLLRIDADTAEGHHDTLFDCCDEWIYANYGCAPGHRNCRDNFREAIAAVGIPDRDAPRPLNLWMNVTVAADGHINFERPTCRPRDEVVLTALAPVVVVLSACPMDVSPVNGGDGTPKDVEWELVPANTREDVAP